MRIGMTYDRIDDYLSTGYSREAVAEFDSKETIDAIAGALHELGHEPIAIGNVRALTARLATGDRWDLVFNIAEGLKGFGRESQVPALLEAYDIPYTFSDPLTLALSLHKGMAKHVLRDLHIPTPDFAVVKDTEDMEHISLPWPLFVKPVAEGTSKGIRESSRVTNRADLVAHCARIIGDFKQPALVETYLPGREFTVGILGTGKRAACLGVLEVLLRGNAEKGVYSFANKEHYKERVIYRLVRDRGALKAAETALAAWRGLGCRDAGRVDIREDEEGIPNVIELNPLAGLHPVNSDLSILASRTGMPYRSLIRAILDAALTRMEDTPASMAL
ncbi:MAG: ATP-grasp domain-containing protein [Syntrophales bacterium]|jgi:D-alanine-D-alanine ligase|nr:ATP-grasp domain-containing protein [Syntrophales bacterium]MCK9527631.1 ATP-grasp domain-containing protein [Syntrophales bacterium]MDX9922248.1 ATP-grasp domain-containing protein [Syntrophales bacterium]